MNITNCTKDEFLEIHRRFEEFWPSGDEVYLRRVKTIHHPIFVHEVGNTSYVMKEDGKIVAYLFCMYSQTEPTGYLHAQCVHPDHRHKGLAGQLCQHFIAGTKGNGSTAVMAASVLTAAGLKTGLYTSPHLIDSRERIKIDGKMISHEDTATHVEALADAARAVREDLSIGMLSFFEV